MASQQVVIRLIGENDQLRKSLQDSQKQIKRLEKQVQGIRKSGKGSFSPLANSAKTSLGPLSGLTGRFSAITKAGAGMAPPLAAAAVGLAGVAEGVQFIGSGLNKLKLLVANTKLLSRETGMSAEQSSAWIGVAGRMGVSTGQLSTTLGIFSKRIVAATNGTKSSEKQLLKFAQAGVSPAILASRNMDRILIAVSNRFKSMPDGINKTELATSLFGRSGRSLIPVLNQGGAKLGALKREMAALGLTISSRTKGQVTTLTKAQRTLNQVWDGLQIRLATKVIPRLSSFAEAMRRAAVGLRSGKKPAGDLAGKLYDIGNALNHIANAGEKVARLGSRLGNSFVGKSVGKALKMTIQALPGFAEGGVIAKATVATVGEDGPEAIVPLTKPRRARAVMSDAGLLGAGNNYFTINTTGPVDEQALARSIGWQLATRGLA